MSINIQAPSLIFLAMAFSNISYADSTAWVDGKLVRTFDGTTHGGWTGTITLDDWGFVGPNGRTVEDFEPVDGFGNGVYDSTTAAACIADPESCGIGQMQHVVTTGPDGITQDPPHDILGDFLSPNGPYPQANVDSLTNFYHWGYTSVAGSLFSNMLIDFDGDYQIAKDDMAFEFYNVMDYLQIVPEGGTRIDGSVPDTFDPNLDSNTTGYNNKLAFQPYAVSDAKGWCGSVMAGHPNAHEAMAGQVTFDVVFDVYFKNDDGTLTYWTSEIIPGFQMRSFGDIAVNLTSADGGGVQQFSAKAIVNNTDPNVSNSSVGPDTPVGDPDVWHNKVSFMGASVIPGMAGDGICGVLTDEWIAGQRGEGIKKFDYLLNNITDSTSCSAVADLNTAWQTAAFAGYAFILRADATRFPDYFDESVYGPDPMTLDSDSDGVLDYADNCIDVENQSQQDTDGDNYGNACDADFNNDMAVNSLDIGLFKQMFFTVGDVEADLNGDQIVNALDLGLFKARFFQPPGPSGTAQ